MLRPVVRLPLVAVLFLAAAPLGSWPLSDPPGVIPNAAIDDRAPGATAAGPLWTPAGPGTLVAGVADAFRLDASGLRVTLDGEFSYRFESAVAGGVPVVALGSVSPGVDALGAAVFERGGLQEKYLAQGGAVEQVFVFPSLPGPGDLVVRGTVSSTAPFEPARSGVRSLAFGALRVSLAAAFDAAGRRVDCDLSYRDGGIEILVPGEWLAGAAMPLVVDPFIGAIFPLDQPPTAASAPFRSTDACYNATTNEYLFVFSFAPATGTDHNIYGRRVNAASGATVGGVITIEGDAADNREPAIAWNSSTNTYLVAWAEGPGGAGHLIRGRVLNANGVDAGAGKLSLSDLTGSQELWPEVASSGTNFLVVWGRIATNSTVYGRIFTGAGAPLGASFAAGGGATDARRPACAYLSSASTFLACWSQAATTTSLGAVTACTISPIGAVGPANTISTVTTQDHDWPRMEANPGSNEALIVWDSDAVRNNNPFSGNPPPDEINARRVGPTAAGLGTQFNIQPAGGVPEWLAHVTWSSVDNEYVVAWSDGNGSTAVSTVQLARIDGGTNTILENDAIVATDPVNDFYSPALAARTNTTEVFIGFLRRIDTPANREHWARLYRTSNAPPPPPPPPPGPRFDLTDNANGNNSINDACGGSAAAPTVGWGAAAFLLTGLALLRRR